MPGPSGSNRTHLQSVSGTQPQQPLEPQATTSGASHQQQQRLIFSNQPHQPHQPQQRASLNSNYDLQAELVQVLVNQQNQHQNQQSQHQNQQSQHQNQQQNNSTENQNQQRSTQEQPQDEDSWINAYRRHR